MLTLLLAVALQSPQLPEKRLTPDLRIAASDVSEDLTHPWAIVEAGGKIFVADPWAPAIFRFDAQGKADGKLGRSGQGPGEYRLPLALGARGDTLWAGDATQHRILLYGVDGAPVRTITQVGGHSSTLAYSADGTSLGLPGWSTARAFPGESPELPILRYRPDGSLRDTVLMLPVQLGQLKIDQPDGMFIVSPQPFDDSPLVGASTSGDGFVIVERRTTGRAEFTVTRYGPDGARRWSTRMDYVAGPIDPSIVDSVIRTRTEPDNPQISPVPEADVRKVLRIPSRLLPVLAVAVAPDGAVWLRRPTAVGRPARYTVLNKDGRPAFEVTTPPGRLMGFGNGTVWLGSKDDDDLPVLVRYRVQ